MIVIVLSACPVSLRGDLTKWLLEINPGVFVGRVSARIREKLWARVLESGGTGRATMVFPADNEQRLEFRVNSADWEPVDFEGVKLIYRPAVRKTVPKSGWSKASRYRRARRG